MPRPADIPVLPAGRPWWEKPAGALLIFVLLALALRWPSFFRSVINHDESTYIVVADALLRGRVYWVDVIDTKPIGIMWVYAAITKILGPGIWGYRLTASLSMAGTAFFLYLIHRALGGAARAGLAAGILYLLVNSIFKFYGVSPNTEHYFNLTTVLSFWLLLWGRNPGVGLPAGLVMGLGFVIKYVVLFDALAVGGWLLWDAWREGRRRRPVAIRIAGFGIGLVLPFLAVWLWYEQQGYGETFRFFSFEMSGRYAVSPHWTDFIRYIGEYHLRFLPVAVLAYWALLSSSTGRKVRELGGLWLLLSAIIVSLPGRFFSHYLIQFSLPLCFLAGAFFGLPGEDLPGGVRWLGNKRVVLILLAALLVANTLLMKKDYIDRPDEPRLVRQAIGRDFRPGDGLYTGNTAWEILYHLVDELPPTPYVHGSLIWDPRNNYALKMDFEREVREIMAVRPRFVLVSTREAPRPSVFWDFLEEHYEPIPIPGLDASQRVTVYERLQD